MTIKKSSERISKNQDSNQKGQNESNANESPIHSELIENFLIFLNEFNSNTPRWSIVKQKKIKKKIATQKENK